MAWLLEYWCLWTAGPAEIRQIKHSVVTVPFKMVTSEGVEVWLTLHQVLMVDGGQVGEVLLEV